MIIALIYICLRDLRSHTISNWANFVLSVLMFFTNCYEVRWLWGLITFLGLLAAGTVLDLGGGDIKLITSLILFGDIEFSLIDYLGISMAVALLHILIDYARKGCVSGNIALAPTICVPMLFSLAAG